MIVPTRNRRIIVIINMNNEIVLNKIGILIMDILSNCNPINILVTEYILDAILKEFIKPNLHGPSRVEGAKFLIG